MLNRSFFSLQSAWIPTMVALGNLGLNAVLAAALYHVGVWGIPLATSLVNIAGTLVLLAVLRDRLGRLDGRAIVASYARIAAASALAAGVGLSARGTGSTPRSAARSAAQILSRRPWRSSPASASTFRGGGVAESARAPDAALARRPLRYDG